MNYIIASKDEAERGVVVKTSFVIISINNPRARAARVKRPSHCVDVLTLRFADVEPVRGVQVAGGPRPITRQQAMQIAAFVHRHKDSVGTILVHCHQGMSRSPAVAAAICKALGDDDRWIWNDHQPNRFVYQMVRSAFAELHRASDGPNQSPRESNLS